MFMNKTKLTFLILISALFLGVGCSNTKVRREPQPWNETNKDEEVYTQEQTSEDGYNDFEIGDEEQQGEPIRDDIKRIFDISKNPTPTEVKNFQYFTNSCFSQVAAGIEEFSTKGFVYRISPQGAAYPFSKVEVACVVGENVAPDEAEELCGKFYECISGKYE
jgi:hypothetical protein